MHCWEAEVESIQSLAVPIRGEEAPTEHVAGISTVRGAREGSVMYTR